MPEPSATARTANSAIVYATLERAGAFEAQAAARSARLMLATTAWAGASLMTSSSVRSTIGEKR
ncbi:hypothetical protein D1872_285120 [compost metagenome]